MPTEPEPVTLASLVHRAVAAVDPEGHAGIEDLLERFEDDDEPLGSYGAEIAAQRIAEEAGNARPAGRGPGRAARRPPSRPTSPSAATRWTRSPASCCPGRPRRVRRRSAGRRPRAARRARRRALTQSTAAQVRRPTRRTRPSRTARRRAGPKRPGSPQPRLDPGAQRAPVERALAAQDGDDGVGLALGEAGGLRAAEGQRTRGPHVPAHAASADVADRGSAISSRDSCSASTPQTHATTAATSMSAEAMP